MKRNKLLVLALLVAMTSFSACTNDAEEVLTQENEIKLTSEITASRVASLDYQSTQIVKGQLVGVTITGAKSEHNNIAWSVGDNGVLTNTSTPVYFGNNQAMITAYHPFNDEWNENKNYDFSVSIDQSTNAEYLASDLLWATAASSKTDKAVGLIFAHKLAKVNVTLTSTDIKDLSDATISICGTNIATNFNPSTGELSAATANVQEIKAGVTTEEAYTASAIVVPQTVANGTKFIKVVHGSKTFYYTLAANKELKSGYSHNYTLTVKEKELEVKTELDKIIDWTDEDGNIGDAEEEVAIPYLTFTADAEQTLTMSKAVATLEYSVNGGEWKTLGTTTVTFGGNNGDLRLRGKSSTGTANSTSDYSQIEFETDVDVACSGDIRTLVDYENYVTVSTTIARFCKLFKDCTNLTSAPQLPAQILASSCYHSMFSGCTSLLAAPELPATSLANHCYCQMFMDCTNLISVPSILPAQELFWSCYYEMFMDCTSLEATPELPATTLAQTCYGGMFSGCKALKTAPKLPATTLASLCYSGMFINCRSLVIAPELPAKTLELQSYYRMFAGCFNLNNITILATDISAEDCLTEWVSYVSNTGTFTKAKEMTSLPSGSNGIPSGWNVVDKE